MLIQRLMALNTGASEASAGSAGVGPRALAGVGPRRATNKC